MNIFQISERKFYLKINLYGFVLLLCGFTICYSQSRRPLNIEDTADLKTISATAISPDGSEVLYAVEEVDRAINSRRSSIWLVASAGGTARKLTGEAVVYSPGLTWSPDGKQFAYFSAKSGSRQVWLADAAGGLSRQLTKEKSDVLNFAYAPDAKTIAYTVLPVSEKLKTNGGIRIVSQETPPLPTELHLINIETGENKLAMKPELAPDGFSFAPEGRQLVFSANDDIFVLNIENGQTRKLVERPGSDTNPIWSPDGRQIAFVSNYGKEEPGENLYISIINADGKTPPQDNFKNFDFGFGGLTIRFFAWSPDGKSLLASKLSRMQQNLYRISLPGGESQRITIGETSVFHDFSLSRDGKTIAFLLTNPVTPSEVFISPLSDFKPKQLTANTNPQLKAIALSNPEVVRWKSKDGFEIEGLLMKPSNYQKGKRYPLLVQMEGTYGTYDLSFTGRVSADTPSVGSPFQQQILAGQGYLVLMPNPRGSWGYGHSFYQLGRQDYGTGPYNDIISGVDYLIESGIADRERIGIMGLGFDAYRTAFAITQTDRFKAASIGQVFGFNLVSWYGQTGGGFIGRMLGGAPWQVPNNYAAISPINFAGNLKTPTFLFNLADPTWANDQSQEFYTALKRNNVPVEYVVYDEDFYRFYTTNYNIWEDVMTRNLNWFNRWLK